MRDAMVEGGISTSDRGPHDAEARPVAPRPGVKTTVRRERSREHRGADYEGLEGGAGREMFFRPQRYKANELGLGRVQVLVTPERGAELDCGLHDLSQNGIAFLPPAGTRFAVNQVLPSIVIHLDGHEAYRGEARVGSVRALGGQVIVGASFTDSLMNIDDVLWVRDVKSWRPEHDQGIAESTQTWHVEGHERFKSLVAEMRLFLDDASAHYGAMEKSLPWHVVHGEGESAARAALIERVGTEFVPEFVRRMESIDAALRFASEPASPRLKEFSIRYLHEILMHAPLLNRTRIKPLGYPGDFLAMDYMYNRPFEGQTLFAKAIHMGSCASVPAQSVRARKTLLRDEMTELARTWKGDRPLRILSVAAGPAQEVFEFLSQPEPVPCDMEIVLFDQDKLALTFAHKRLVSLVDARGKGRIRLRLLHDAIKRLLEDATIFGDLGPFDLLFSAGLFDYLRFPTAARLARNFWLNLEPGGRAFIGNMDPGNPSRWMFEHHLDWFLIYRKAEEMLEFGAAGVPEARSEVRRDLTGINPFLVLHRD